MILKKLCAVLVISGICVTASATSSIDVFPGGSGGKNFCDAFNALITNPLLGSLPPEFQGLINAFQPETADINGSIVIDTAPDPDSITINGNGIRDANNELRILEKILKDTSFNVNGLTHNAVHAAWNANNNMLRNTYMGAANAAIIDSLVPGLIPILVGYITVGGGTVTQAGTVTTATGSFGVAKLVYDLAAPAVGGVGIDFPIDVLNPADFVFVTQLQAAGDIDGDGCTNLAEYLAGTPATCSTSLNATGVYTDDAVNASVANCSVGEGEGEAGVRIISQRNVYEEGDRVELRAYATGMVGGVLYQWKKDGTDIPGATSSSFVITSAASSDTGVYVVQATDQSKGVFVSDPFTLTILPQGSLPVSGAVGMVALAMVCALAGLVGLRPRRV